MAEHFVICHTCRTPNGRNPKRWRWLCEHCAQECADTHRHQTGHDVELRITREPTMTDLQRDIRTLRITQRRGW